MKFLEWLKLWLRGWPHRRCRAHNIIGTECSRCGWELRMLNVYLPPGHPGLTSSQKRRIRARLSPPLLIVKEFRSTEASEGADLPPLSWAPVGFDLTMEDHVWLTEHLLGLRMVEAS